MAWKSQAKGSIRISSAFSEYFSASKRRTKASTPNTTTPTSSARFSALSLRGAPAPIRFLLMTSTPRKRYRAEHTVAAGRIGHWVAQTTNRTAAGTAGKPNQYL